MLPDACLPGVRIVFGAASLLLVQVFFHKWYTFLKSWDSNELAFFSKTCFAKKFLLCCCK